MSATQNFLDALSALAERIGLIRSEQEAAEALTGAEGSEGDLEHERELPNQLLP